MGQALLELGIFAAQSIIVLIIIVAVMLTFFVLLAKSKVKTYGRLSLKNVNHVYDENKQMMLEEILPKKALKKFLKEQKAAEKKRAESQLKNIFVLNFHGDMQASAVSSLTKEITAVLNVATPKDEVLVRIESGGGVVHGYGLGASQLMRLRQHQIPLTVAIDKVAASGGYLMACTANKILAAPFAIVGSIGVVIQMPNFNRVLKDKNIDFEMHTAGEFKRTITMFGENTDEGREKLQQEINEVHAQFKDLIHQHRPQMDIAQAATGEYWLAEKALALKLVDELQTSDEYLLQQSKNANIYEVSFEEKKSFLARLTAGAQSMMNGTRHMLVMK